jgi:hypothetical protein
VDTRTQTFEIDVIKLHPKHNVVKAEDVNNDGARVAEDALSIVNFINTFGATEILESDAIGPLFYDVTGDNNIAADDALQVINYVNTFGAGEGENSEFRIQNAEWERESRREGEWANDDELMSLLVMDVVGVGRKRR